MGERGGGPSGRDAAGLAGDAVMSAVEELVERLRRPGEAEIAVSGPAVVPSPPAEHAGRSLPALPASLPNGAAVALVSAVVAAVVPAVMRRMDMNAVLDEVDVQRIVDRVDVEALVARIDLDAVAARIDVDALVERVDMDALVQRMDIGAVAREAVDAVDIGEIVRESSATIGTDVVDGLRLQTIRADDLLARWVDAVLRRKEPRDIELRPRRGAA